MAAVDVAFKLTCATLFGAALASGAWLTASMIKGYKDVKEFEVGFDQSAMTTTTTNDQTLFSNLDLLLLKKKKKKNSEHTHTHLPPKKETHRQPKPLESLLLVPRRKTDCVTLLFLNFASFLSSCSLSPPFFSQL